MVKSSAARLDSIFHALSDSTRRSILRDVAMKERTVGEVAKPYRISLAAVSRHLNVLESAELIARERRGSFQIVRLRAQSLRPAEEWLAWYEKFWSRQVAALQSWGPRQFLRQRAGETLKVEIRRVIRAGRQWVFEALTRAEEIVKWFGPEGTTVLEAVTDPREGGSWRIVTTPCQPGHGTAIASNRSGAHGEYLKVIPGQLLSFTWKPDWSPGEETVVTMELRDVAGGTELTLRHEKFATEESQRGHEKGWTGTMDKLAAFLGR